MHDNQTRAIALADRVMALVLEDVEAGEFYPSGATLDSFSTLHDYVDANGYLIEVLPDEVYPYELSNEVTEVVSRILAEAPIVVGR
jgi:hypothetical protein